MAIADQVPKRRLHAVMVAHPAQGHMTPGLQLAKKLVALHGFRVTFINTTDVHNKFMKVHRPTAPAAEPAAEPFHEGIEFMAVPDGLAEDHPRQRDISAFLKTTLLLTPLYKDLFINIQKTSGPINVIILDVELTTPVHPAAKSLGIPVAFFVTSSAISKHCRYAVERFISAGVLPLPASPTPSLNEATGQLSLPQTDAEATHRNRIVTCLDGASPTMRVEHIPTFLLVQDLEAFYIRYSIDQVKYLPDSLCILCNTFVDLEGEVLSAMSKSLNENMLAIGPLVMNTSVVDGVERVKAEGVRSGLLQEDPLTLTWLEEQKPRSVLYVAFGSVAMVSMQQLTEFAAGLEASKVPFLWVIRPELIAEESGPTAEFQTMFDEFIARTKASSLVVPWAPQTAVLSHPAVGGFLTHCGWNSCLESISCGMPMLGWPRHEDQTTNLHYITDVWKIGLQLEQRGETIVVRDEVETKVKRIMGDSVEVEDIRVRCKGFAMAAKKAVGRGGSSHDALGKFVEMVAKADGWKDGNECICFTLVEILG